MLEPSFFFHFHLNVGTLEPSNTKKDRALFRVFIFFGLLLFSFPFQSLLFRLEAHSLTCGSALLPRVTVASIVPWGSEVAT